MRRLLPKTIHRTRAARIILRMKAFARDNGKMMTRKNAGLFSPAP
jgi:hypothetical protein